MNAERELEEVYLDVEAAEKSVEIMRGILLLRQHAPQLLAPGRSLDFELQSLADGIRAKLVSARKNQIPF